MAEPAIEYARCWWCGNVYRREELAGLEGARLVGSEPLRLPDYVAGKDRREILVCERDAIAFALARFAHNVELAEIGGEDPGTIDLDRVELYLGRTVADRLRRYLSERRSTG